MSKLKSKITRNRKQRAQRQPTQTQAKEPVKQRSWMYTSLLVACFLVGGVGTLYVFDNYVWAKVPAEMVGKWGVDGGPQDGATLVFSRDGTLVATVNVNGKKGIIQSQVRVNGKKLTITSTHPITNEQKMQTQWIEKLTDRELILKDESGVTFKMVRLR